MFSKRSDPRFDRVVHENQALKGNFWKREQLCKCGGSNTADLIGVEIDCPDGPVDLKCFAKNQSFLIAE